MTEATDLLLRCLSLDLEVGKENNRINAFGAVRADTCKPCVYPERHSSLTAALAQLDEFAAAASFVLGHNLIAFDLPHLAAAKPELRLLKLPVVDTLRLNPLAFPSNPYHHLVKHYQDGGIRQGRLNDPELDARLALEVFGDQRKKLASAAPDLLTAWHWLCAPQPEGVDRALDALFTELRNAHRPSEAAAKAAIDRRLQNAACVSQRSEVVAQAASYSWALAYALAWLSVSGGNSVMPPWVRHQFPEAGRLVRSLRDIACTAPGCGWCRERHDARKELKRWFGFNNFRGEPLTDDGRPMQQAIVETAMAGKHVLGILPTGTGKSLCYQIPALSRYDKTGALTVVISPLVALMADQVKGLEASGVGSCVAINGLLSMPERADALDRVRLGDASILLISPEQLRSRSLRRALEQRELGAWVLDEAHCLSRWGHDFRPDYLYVGRFIKERAGPDGETPPVLCLTATAKPDVVKDIKQHFRDKLGIALTVFDGGAERTNLVFEVILTSESEKFAHIHQNLMSHLPPHKRGGAIIYCATRRHTEEVAEYLQEKDVRADYFHGRLSPEIKKEVQRRFIDGELRAISATNAFGMGIDKPDVRLVIHADIPGSLENYLQEAGRAGRDRDPARCVLLYTRDDVERQFGMSARARLTRAEIHGILRALRNLDRKKRFKGEVVATSGEILGEDEENAFERDSATDDTRVRTAVAWLEEAGFLAREENFVQVFPSSLQVGSVEEAEKRLANTDCTDSYRGQLLRITEALIQAPADEGVSTDELTAISGLSPEGVRGALYDLERLGIASNDTELTAFVHIGVEHSSRKRLEQALELETALIAHLREKAPELEKRDTSSLHLRIAAQVLRDQGLSDPLPERLWCILRGIAYDGRGEDGTAGSLSVRKQDAETVRVTLQRDWSALEETARRRREGAKLLLNHLIDCLPPGSRGTDLLAETTLGKLLQALESDLILKRSVKDTAKLMGRALLWLHELEVIRLNKGLVVFRPAMTIRLAGQEKRGFAKADFKPLALHYEGQVLQIHVMMEFAERGLDAMREALWLARDYFTLEEDEFLARWLPGKNKEIGRETTPESWRAIVESLQNPVQQRIVADDREQVNVLALAGPGSGKTRVLVHRIAYLLRVRRENARGILALAYNRHAAVELRRRLMELVGADARGVTVLTCHALAMRLVGASFTGFRDRQGQRPTTETFDEILRQAVALLRGEGLEAEEADERRECLLAGFRWILVDEYQDIEQAQYDLVSALAGRTLEDENRKLTMFAVGDDDQNIYAFKGASVQFIRCFEQDYQARLHYLTDNYRSTAHIVNAANALIDPARERMKSGSEHRIRVNKARAKEPDGGHWEALDPVGRGRVQRLQVQQDPALQAQTVMAELQRLARLASEWSWSKCAVIAREWKYLDPVRAFCEHEGIPAQMADEECPNFWRLRETQALLHWLGERNSAIAPIAQLEDWLDAQTAGPWIGLLREAVEEYALETGGAVETPRDHFTEWLAEWGQELRRRQQGLLLLTAHRAKGLEFDHVAVLDGGWESHNRNEDADAARRLYYVAMTRARHTLALACFDRQHEAAGAGRRYGISEPPPSTPYLRTAPRLQDAVPADSPALTRIPAEPPARRPELELVYPQITLAHIDLGFAGRQPNRAAVHKHIAALTPGDALQMRTEPERRTLLDGKGNLVGRLAQSFEPPTGMKCRSARVQAIVQRRREDTPPEFLEHVQCNVWEVVVPKLVFEPDC